MERYGVALKSRLKKACNAKRQPQTEVRIEDVDAREVKNPFFENASFFFQKSTFLPEFSSGPFFSHTWGHQV